MKFEVLTGEDAEKARLAGAKLVFWDYLLRQWKDRPYPEGPCDHDTFYCIKPTPKTRRVPLPDLRVLAGSMLVHPENGAYEGIDEIRPDGRWLKSAYGTSYDSEFLAERSYHYALGGSVLPCWTEEVEG